MKKWLKYIIGFLCMAVLLFPDILGLSAPAAISSQPAPVRWAAAF